MQCYLQNIPPLATGMPFCCMQTTYQLNWHVYCVFFLILRLRLGNTFFHVDAITSSLLRPCPSVLSKWVKCHMTQAHRRCAKIVCMVGLNVGIGILIYLHMSRQCASDRFHCRVHLHSPNITVMLCVSQVIDINEIPTVFEITICDLLRRCFEICNFLDRWSSLLHLFSASLYSILL